MSINISNTARTYCKLPYLEIKDDILGKKYDLSLVFVGKKLGSKINQKSRGKTYSPNVLSFPFSEDSGEIYMTPVVIKEQAPKFGYTYKKHMTFLFIHGLLHLKGYDHGAKMEALEEKYLNKYSSK